MWSDVKWMDAIRSINQNYHFILYPTNLFKYPSSFLNEEMRIIYAFFSIVLFPYFSLSCSCVGLGSFCEILPGAIQAGSLVVQGSPIRTIGHGMEFEIKEVIAGSVERRRIMIWGDPGYLCRTYVTGFERKDELVLILDPITRDRTENSTGETERAGDYALSGCGEFFVYLNGRNKTKQNCFSIKKSRPAPLEVFPNPTNGSFRLYPSSEIAIDNIVEVKAFKASGQLLSRPIHFRLSEQDGSIVVDTEGWRNNLYFIEIRTLQNRWLAKVMVLR